jgi:hypothetical protein
MSKKIRLEVLADHKNHKTIIHKLKNTPAIMVSSSPIKGGGFSVKFSIKNIVDKKTVDQELATVPVTCKEFNG